MYNSYADNKCLNNKALDTYNNYHHILDKIKKSRPENLKRIYFNCSN